MTSTKTLTKHLLLKMSPKLDLQTYKPRSVADKSSTSKSKLLRDIKASTDHDYPGNKFHSLFVLVRL